MPHLPFKEDRHCKKCNRGAQTPGRLQVDAFGVEFLPHSCWACGYYWTELTADADHALVVSGEAVTPKALPLPTMALATTLARPRRRRSWLAWLLPRAREAMPLKPRCQDLVGLRARTTHRLETRFVCYPVGTEVKIFGTYRGTFTLKPEGFDQQWPPLQVLKAPRWSFELVDKPVPRLTEHELAVLEELSEPNKNPENWWKVPVRWRRACEALVELGLARSHAEREGDDVFSITDHGRNLFARAP